MSIPNICTNWDDPLIESIFTTSQAAKAAAERVKRANSTVRRNSTGSQLGRASTIVPWWKIDAQPMLGGGFRYFLFSSLFGEDEPILTIFFNWVETTN